MTLKKQLLKAQNHLSSNDPVMKQLIHQIGPCRLQPAGDPFGVLVRSIVSQLISTKAASTIHGKVAELCPGSAITPKAISKAGLQSLRACGLSQSKASTILNLASASLVGEINLDQLALAEEEVISETLIQFKGIGPWTIHMFLIFGLCRLNVLPLGDLGVRMAVRDLYQLNQLPSPSDLRACAVYWDPYCSVASWYLWRSRG